jgi:hypothetical protein
MNSVSVLAAALAMLLVASPSSAQEKKRITLAVLEGGPASCNKTVDYNIQIYPDKLVMSTAGGGGTGVTETFVANASGDFARDFKSANGAQYRVSGNLQQRSVRAETMRGGFPVCSYGGTF